MRSLTVHPVLTPSYSLQGFFNHYPNVNWDVRYSALTAIISSTRGTSSYWNSPATSPPSTTLRLVCGIYPLKWHIEVRNLYGVTVGDVLDAIHRSLRIRLTPAEWETTSHYRRNKIWKALSRRVSESVRSRYGHVEGVRRVDSLLKRTGFGGLSGSRDVPHTWIVNLNSVHN